MGSSIGKMLYVIAFIFLAICYAIVRWISNQRNVNYGAKLIKALDASPELADEVAADYQNQYAKVSNKDGQSLQKRLAAIQKGQAVLRKFRILGIYPLKNDGLLLVTSCQNKEMGEWESTEVNRNYSFNFVVQHKESTGEIEVCSDYYELLIDRLLRQDFAKYVVEVIEKNG